MDELRREDIPQVSEKENEGHKTSPKQKNKEVIFEIKNNTALGPDGFLLDSYQT